MFIFYFARCGECGIKKYGTPAGSTDEISSGPRTKQNQETSVSQLKPCFVTVWPLTRPTPHHHHTSLAKQRRYLLIAPSIYLCIGKAEK